MGADIEPPTLPTAAPTPSLAERQLALEQYKAELDYKKFKLGSVAAAIALATIPPSFQLATAFLEKNKAENQIAIDQRNKNSESIARQNEFRDQYVKEFLDKALSQDIEFRIRFAEYFASVAADSHRSSWKAYLSTLQEKRDRVRLLINAKEAEWQAQAGAGHKDQTSIDTVERELTWYYKEVGYIEGNRSVSPDPRNPQTARSPSLGDISASETRTATSTLRFDIDPSRLIEAISKNLLIKINSQQSNTINAMIQYWSDNYKDKDTRLFAYILATVYHETNRSMAPLEEVGKGRNLPYGLPDPDSGHTYYGRGLIQLIWSQNYKKIASIIGVDIYGNPDLALDTSTSAAIAIEVMMRGLVTGKKLTDYLSSDKFDPINARRSLNSLDRAELISNHYFMFLDAFQSAKK